MNHESEISPTEVRDKHLRHQEMLAKHKTDKTAAREKHRKGKAKGVHKGNGAPIILV
jgi:hypothetical protein